MDMDQSSEEFYRESQSLSPQASTDEKSIHRNWQQNREALQKRLSIRRPVDDLVNNGIMMSPLKTPPCYAEKMRQLERAKTTDLLKQKIQHRPDAQSLVDRHILPEWPPDEIGGSPQVFEQQQLMRRNELMSSLNAKLEQRPGSLEMAEKGLLPLAPPMQTLLRDGSISYPRVDETVSEMDELESIVSSSSLQHTSQAPTTVTPIISCVPTVSTANISTSIPSSERNSNILSTSGSYRRSRTPHGISSRSRKTMIGTSKVGNFVFHTYNPPKKCNSSPSPGNADNQVQVVEREIEIEPTVMNLNANTARQIQQAEYLRLQESEDKQNILMQQLVHDIRSRQDGGSPMKVQRNEPNSLQTAPLQPPTTVTSSGFVAFSGLASLNVQQLKEECRRYKVPRTGNKMNLIRNLEPFQQEILRKYVLSATTSPTFGSPAGSQMAMGTGFVTSNGGNNCIEDQAMRHSSSAPQLNIAAAGKVPTVTSDDISSADATSPQGQWPHSQTNNPPTVTCILLNHQPMTLQPVLVAPQRMMSTAPAPPPPPPPPPNQTLVIHQSPAQASLHSQPSSPEQRIKITIKDEIDDDAELIRRVEELERQIVQNIQESDAYKASHNGNRPEHIERQRQILMVNYANLKKKAKAQLQERIDNTRLRLIELCENEATFKELGNVEALEVLERQRELVLSEYNKLNGILMKIKANSTPNASVSSESRMRSYTDSSGCSIPSVSINRPVTVGEEDFKRNYSPMVSSVNGVSEDSLPLSKHFEKRLPSVEFQMLNEVLNQDHDYSKVLPNRVLLSDGNGVTESCDFSNWLTETETSIDNYQQMQQHHPACDQQMQDGRSQQLILASQTHQNQTHQNGHAVVEVADIPMSPMQTDFSSRCSTPHRPAHADPPSGDASDPMQGQGQFNFDEFLNNTNMDIPFPSLGGHPSAASMTEQILTPNTQNALYQFIQPDVVNMETDNDVFAP